MGTHYLRGDVRAEWTVVLLNVQLRYSEGSYYCKGSILAFQGNIYIYYHITTQITITEWSTSSFAYLLQGVWCLPAEGKRRKSAGFGQTEREQQAVCQLEYDAIIKIRQRWHLKPDILRRWRMLYILLPRNNTNNCILVVGLLFSLAFLAWLLHIFEWHAGGFHYWLIARSSSCIITNKDDSQDMINYV